MIYLAVDEDGHEGMYYPKPIRGYEESGFWYTDVSAYYVQELLPSDTIEKIIGKRLTWEDEPVILGENDNL
jgi:hypothetical protein